MKICDWNPYSTGMILYPQKDKLHSIAIPAAIQKSSVRSLGTRIIMTKFVDAPVVDSIGLSPGTIPNDGTIECVATASDPDGETPALTYAWENLTDTAALGTSASLTLTPATASGGEQIQCTATATDEDGGEGTGTGTVTIDNTAPEVDAVSISPDPAYNNDTLICTATASDADGDTSR